MSLSDECESISLNLEGIEEKIGELGEISVSVDNIEEYHDELKAIKKELFNLNDCLLVLIALKFIEVNDYDDNKMFVEELEKTIGLIMNGVCMPPLRK